MQVYPEASSQDLGRAAGWEAADRVGVLNADDADQLLLRGGFGFGRARHSQQSMRVGGLAVFPGPVLEKDIIDIIEDRSVIAFEARGRRWRDAHGRESGEKGDKFQSCWHG